MRPTKQASTYRIICSGILLGCLLFNAAVSPGFAARKPSKQQLRQKKVALQQSIAKVQKKLRVVKTQERQSRKSLFGVQHEVRVARGQLHAATLRLRRAQLQLKGADSAYQESASAYAQSQESVGKRLVVSYERGSQDNLEFFLAADDFGDLLERIQLVRFMREQDRGALDDLRQRKVELQQHKAMVKAKTDEVARMRQQVALWHARTVSQHYVAAEKLSQVREVRSDYEADYAALMRDSAEITSMLQQQQNTVAGRRRYNTTYVGNVGGLPVRGRITSRFGWRIHPISRVRRMHTGVDIAAPSGTPIAAAGGGEVIFAGRKGGYGNAVIIDHGRGRTTLYGHMSRIQVRVGQVVQRGLIVGNVGSTGFSTGPHLHFEVRQNGNPVNPL